MKDLPDYSSGSVQNETISNYSALASSTLMNGTLSFWIYPTTIQNYNNPFSTGGLSSSNIGFRFEENGSLTLNLSTTYFPSQLGDVNIGAGYDTTRTWDGLIDEVAIWSRTLSATEILQLNRRGSNRIQFQVRSCPDSTCSTNPTWQGPSGTNSTYFSELFNNSNQIYSGSPFPSGGDLNSGYTVLPSLPSMLFSNFSGVTGLSTTLSPYFQYQALFSSDDSSTSCSYSSSASTWCSPELQSITLNTQ